jgi:hypothetical protein
MLVTRVLDTFASETPPEPDPIGAGGVDEMESRVTALVDTFAAAPVEQHPTR